jgi:hypothetical protein
LSQRNSSLLARDDVVVGEDVAVGTDDHAGTEATFDVTARAVQIGIVAKEVAEKRVVGKRRVPTLDDLCR